MRQKLVILPKLNSAGGKMEKSWFIFFSARDPLSGKMVRFRKSENLNSFKTKKGRSERAVELIEEYSTKLKNGWSPFGDESEAIYSDQLHFKSLADIYKKKRKSNRTLNFFINQFIEDISGKLAEASKHTYISKFRTFNLWMDERGLTDDDISIIENKRIVEFFLFLVNERKLSGNSIKKYRQILGAFFEYMVKHKHLRFNPVYNLPECNRINDQAPRPVYSNDIEVFKKAISKEDPQLWLAIEFQFYCYLRPGTELRLLKIGDIDFARGLIFISRENFKTRRENVKEIPEHFLLKLRNHYDLLSYSRECYVIGKHGMPSLENLSKNNLRFRFNKFRKSLKMPDTYKLYSWKHTGGVTASESGIPDKDISDQMGHTSLNTTSAYLKAKGGRRIVSIRNNYPRL